MVKTKTYNTTLIGKETERRGTRGVNVGGLTLTTRYGLTSPTWI